MSETQYTVVQLYFLADLSSLASLVFCYVLKLEAGIEAISVISVTSQKKHTTSCVRTVRSNTREKQ